MPASARSQSESVKAASMLVVLTESSQEPLPGSAGTRRDHVHLLRRDIDITCDTTFGASSAPRRASLRLHTGLLNSPIYDPVCNLNAATQGTSGNPNSMTRHAGRRPRRGDRPRPRAVRSPRWPSSANHRAAQAFRLRDMAGRWRRRRTRFANRPSPARRSDGATSFIRARARCNALLTAVTLTSGIAATSTAGNASRPAGAAPRAAEPEDVAGSPPTPGAGSPGTRRAPPGRRRCSPGRPESLAAKPRRAQGTGSVCGSSAGTPRPDGSTRRLRCASAVKTHWSRSGTATSVARTDSRSPCSPATPADRSRG